MSYEIKSALSDKEILGCFEVISQLRPHLCKANFIQTIREQMDEGYTLAYLQDYERVKCVAGFRFLRSLSAGYHMYVDDLVSDEESRSSGYGALLFDWLVELAKSKGCKKIRLDSGVQRFRAHRFYLRKGMDITCHHFDLVL